VRSLLQKCWNERDARVSAAANMYPDTGTHGTGRSFTTVGWMSECGRSDRIIFHHLQNADFQAQLSIFQKFGELRLKYFQSHLLKIVLRGCPRPIIVDSARVYGAKRRLVLMKRRVRQLACLTDEFFRVNNANNHGDQANIVRACASYI
jgi:hypothetical protein